MDKRCKKKNEMKTKTDGWDGATRLYIALPFCPRLTIEREKERRKSLFFCRLILTLGFLLYPKAEEQRQRTIDKQNNKMLERIVTIMTSKKSKFPGALSKETSGKDRKVRFSF